jgi:uncharacterized protein (DUF58 family)
MLSAHEVRQLDRLTFGAANASPTTRPDGPRSARRRGFGSEFHDFRQYQPGDDPRSIEWTIYSRLGLLVTRTYRTNGQLRVHLLLDVSASMSTGVPDKLSCAAKIAAILGYVAIRAGQAVGFSTFRETIAYRLAPSGGRAHLSRMFASLSTAAASGPSAIDRSLTTYATLERGPGVAVVISDFFDANALDGLRYLVHRGLSPAIVQVLSADEIDPPFAQDVELVDIETPDAPPLIADSATVSAYKHALDESRASLRAFCDTHALPILHVTSSDSFADVLLACARAGLLIGRT